MAPLFALVHSPLVGPLTWSLVAEELRRQGVQAVVPSLPGDQRAPYWQAQVAAVACALAAPVDCPAVLVAHSGAGPLLPAIGQGIAWPAAGYIFVDAALPHEDGQSRLDLFEPGEAERFRGAVANGMISSMWRDEALLRAIGIEDECLRRQFIAEVPDVPLEVYEEPLPVPPGWPDAPCGYLLFSAPYEADARHAAVLGWASRELRGGHFQMLVDPPAVAGALLRIAGEIGIQA